MLKIRFIFLMTSLMAPFACSSSNVMQHDIDEVIYESHVLMAKKNYNQAKGRLEGLLQKTSYLSNSQKLNVLNKLLEISFIQKEYKRASLYGHQLYKLMDSRDKYEEVQTRLFYRLCESEDWEGGRQYFTDICKAQKSK